MGNRRTFKIFALFSALFVWATIVWANSSGAPASNTGAPGEATCTVCHSTNPLNSGDGSVTITGLPQNYTPGTKYNLTVTVSKSDKMRWGFQVAALNGDGGNAGAFTITDSGNTQMVINSVSGKTRNYVEHTLNGTQRGVKSSASFKFDWTAPSSDIGKVTFYVVGNAANGDSTLVGDNIYSTTMAINAVAAPATPTLTKLNPDRGPSTGGTTVTLTGTNFRNGTMATFDGIAAPSTFVDDKNLRVTTPPHAAGTVDVVVTNPDGQLGRLRSSFTYEDAQSTVPVIAGINPPMGSTTGGTAVTLIGTNFQPGANVRIGDRDSLVMSLTPTQIVVQTQPNNSGAANVIVTNPDGQVAVLTGAYNYVGDNPTPFVKLLTPNGGEVIAAGGASFLVTWQQLSSSAATQKLELSLDGGQTFSMVIADNLPANRTSMLFAAASGMSGTNARIRISITDNGATLTDTSDQSFSLVAAPTITNIAPKVAATIKLKITGSNFQKGAVIEVNGTAVSTAVKSATSIIGKKISKSLDNTAIRVRVRNPDGGVSAEMVITP